MVRKKFSYLFGLSLFEGNIVWISTKNVFEFTLQFINIIVMFASKLELNFFVLYLVPLLLFRSFVEIFSQVFNDSIEVMAVFLPKLA